MEIIYCYTRAQALSDGVLIDVTKTAQEAGLRHPTALTCSVWERYVRVPEGVAGQDEAGRLWDIVAMLRYAILRLPEGGHTNVINYQLNVRNDNDELELITLKSVCGPGDDGEPVLTIMLLSED